ncbi:efflux RND transporter permease subunit [Planctobacterium marinum]|uniref:Acriflavin resistance protein n=1 Tax=Planctobacterium marinum TaxID=1631968 RepID=A0AA48HJR0_9ALTE|nr:acriflavin resistance protein [Planctobacterium marinum]
MIRFFAAHPTAANLMMLLLLVLGLITVPELKRETFPLINKYTLDINVVYPGATPADVEQNICLPIERAFDGISFVDEKICQSRQNMAIFSIKMQENGNFEQFKDDVKTALDGITEFPSEVESPVITEQGREQDVITIALTAEVSKPELKQMAEMVKQKLLRNPQIPLIDIEGFSTRQIRIQVSQQALREYGLSIQSLAQIIAKQNFDLPLGTIETQWQDVQLRFNNESIEPEHLRQLVVLSGANGNELKLGQIATIVETFEFAEQHNEYQGQTAALLKVRKNSLDDSLDVLAAVETELAKIKQTLPENVNLALTQDATSIIKDRIQLLGTNAWQGLLLVFAVMWLFFTWRYAFWVVMGLPVSFLASAFVLAWFGITINMISMVALLLALGILMDDAIVIAESIGTQMRLGKKPLQAAIEGTQIVARGVLSSFLTTLSIFIGLVYIEGDLGQILKVIPIVLIAVISVSLIEAFFILPRHLYHSLSHEKKQAPNQFRQTFDRYFEQLRNRVYLLSEKLIQFRYAFIGGVVAVLLLSISIPASGILKFSAFPNVEGDIIQARVMMAAGTPLSETETVTNRIIAAANAAAEQLQVNERETLIKAVSVAYSHNADAMETGPHLATLTFDLLTAEQRNTRLQDFIELWREELGEVANAHAISFKEPAIGPSGRAIEIRLSGDNYETLSAASHELQTWLQGYAGVNNLLDDLRPGKPEFSIQLKEGAYALGIDSQAIATQLRAAFQGEVALKTNVNNDELDIVVLLEKDSRNSFDDLDNFVIIHPKSQRVIPLSSVADVKPSRGYSRTSRVNNQRTVTVYGDINPLLNNTSKVIKHLQSHFLAQFVEKYPGVDISLQGEVKNSAITQDSMTRAFILGLFGVFILLSFQFRSYVEPLIVMVAIPMALVGVIWGHMIMNIDLTMPSMLGFVSLAGIVVNDSILLVEFVKRHVKAGLSVHDAAAKATYDRFRAVLLTSITTIAGMTPLMFETSLQAQVLIPLAVSIVFGIAVSTLMILLVIPCLYSILEDFGVANATPSDAS